MPISIPRRPSAPGLLAVLCLVSSSATPLPAAPNSERAAAVHAPKVSGRPAQIALAALAGAVAQSPLQAVEPTLASAGLKSQSAVVPAALSRQVPVQVLMIGDSLSVGGFGESVQQYLFRRYGPARVAFYASCGSSPESWLKGEPDYVTKCGYKCQTPKRSYYTDYDSHGRPTPTLTPKIEDLVAMHQPAIVIIQLGTNWMDGLEARSFSNEQPKLTSILDRFTAAIRSSKSVKQIIWITPPDSSRYSSQTERNVDAVILAASKRDKFTLVNSASMTHYVAGKTGGDGVHYRKEDAYAWAESVQRDLRGKLR